LSLPYGQQLKRVSQPIIKRLAPWAGFWGIFLWCWRVRDLFHRIPAYGDALEVIWGIRYYYDSLFVMHRSPLFTPLVFHPWGWQTATLAHTPVFFLAALPFYALGGAAFAYNILAIVPSVVSFAGVFRFVRLFASRFSATVAALVFTFVYMRWFRVQCHLHILWAISLLPWLAWTIENINRKPEWTTRKAIWRAGLIWGMMINVSLYSIFLGGLVFIFLGKKFWQIKNILRVLATAVLALVLASPTIVLYWRGSQLIRLYQWGIAHNLHWGISLNGLFAPFTAHSLEIVRKISSVLYSGPHDESGVSTLGLVTCVLACVGLVLVIKKRPCPWGLLWLTIGGGLLAMGLLFKWNGVVVQIDGIRGLDAILWRIGHSLKPGLFPTVLPEPGFEAGIPLPGFLMMVFVPFWESARALDRYVFLAMLGAVTLAAIALQKFPKLVRYSLVLLWLVEILPPPTTEGVPVYFQLHPAYAWLASQSLEVDEGIVDMSYPTLSMGGEVLTAASLHGKPTISGQGSFFPEPTIWLWNHLTTEKEALSRPYIGALLHQYHVRYLFLHMLGNREQGMWSMVVKNPVFQPVGCFDPLPEVTPWPYPICVAELRPVAARSDILLRQTGWSPQENWGTWAQGLVSTVQWLVATQQDYSLRLEALPFCAPGRYQAVTIKINGQMLTHHQWQGCETWEEDVAIPSSFVKSGWNQLTFEYGYAVSPSDVTGGMNPDLRLLSVGFVKLEVIE